MNVQVHPALYRAMEIWAPVWGQRVAVTEWLLSTVVNNSNSKVRQTRFKS